MWRSHKSAPKGSSITSRRANDAATSSGLRTGTTTRGVTPTSASQPFHTVSRRQSRGSFSTKSGLSPNSPTSALSARSRYGRAAGESCQAGLKTPQSSHDEPADARMASFSSVMTEDSQ